MNIFSSKSLNQVHADSSELVTAHVQRLDQISSDIMTLETILKKAAIPFTFVYVITAGSKETRDAIVHTEDCLVWGESEVGGVRLLYQSYEIVDEFKEYIETHYIEEGKPMLVFSKSLIETKANIRLSSEFHLSSFYEKVIESLKSRYLKDCRIVNSEWLSETILEKRGF